MKERFVDIRFSARSRTVIQLANRIIDDYRAQGFDLTLRQLYYQFVSRNAIRNNEAEYKKLGSIINDARLAGLVDWDAIVDRTRYTRKNNHWTSPKEILEAAHKSYYRNKWEGQTNYCEVWIEKDALVGVIEPICKSLDVPFFSCRGYVSQSEMYEAAKRLRRQAMNDKTVTVFHLGDHDPSGLDMSRDIQARINLLSGDVGVVVERLALTMTQIEELNPPPNPAKVTDSRAERYVVLYGDKSWELDALEPTYIRDLIKNNVTDLIDEVQWESVQKQEDREKELIVRATTLISEPEIAPKKDKKRGRGLHS